MSPIGDVKHFRATTNHIPNTGTLVLNPLHSLLGCVKEAVYTHPFHCLNVFNEFKICIQVASEYTEIQVAQHLYGDWLLSWYVSNYQWCSHWNLTNGNTNYETTIIRCTDFILCRFYLKKYLNNVSVPIFQLMQHYKWLYTHLFITLLTTCFGQ